MSTSIYRYRKSVWYDQKPSHCYGWCMSTSGDYCVIALFSTKKRQSKFVCEINKRIEEWTKLYNHEREIFSGCEGEWEAMYISMLIGYGNEDNDWIIDELSSRMSEKLKTFLLKLSEEYDIISMIC